MKFRRFLEFGQPYLSKAAQHKNEAVEAIEYLAKSKRWKLVLIDCNRTQNEKSFLTEFSIKLDFPSYFGMNINALVDCLRDMSWVDNEAVVIVYIDSGKFLTRETDSYVADLLSIYFDINEFWKHSRIDDPNYFKERFIIKHIFINPGKFLNGRVECTVSFDE